MNKSMVPNLNLNQYNLIAMGSGAIGMFSSMITKKEPWATIGVVIGLGVGLVGVLDATGIAPVLSNFYKKKSSNYASNSLPYDANNYYISS